MKTQEILSIIALSLLGLCFLSGLVKMAMKKESHKKPYEQGCTASVFIAVVLLGISQLLTEREPYDNCQQWRKCKPSELKSGICLDSNKKPAGYCESGCCIIPGFSDEKCDYGSCTIGKSSPACPTNSPYCCTLANT